MCLETQDTGRTWQVDSENSQSPKVQGLKPREDKCEARASDNRMDTDGRNNRAIGFSQGKALAQSDAQDPLTFPRKNSRIQTQGPGSPTAHSPFSRRTQAVRPSIAPPPLGI